MGENVALIILRLRLLKEGAVLSESLLSQVRRSLSLFKGPLEIKLPKTNPGDHNGSCGGSSSSRRRRKVRVAAALRRGWAPRSWAPRSSHSLSNQLRRRVVEGPRCPLATQKREPRASGAARRCRSFCSGVVSLPSGLSNDSGLRQEKQRSPRGAESTTACRWKRAAGPHSPAAPRAASAGRRPGRLGV